MEELAFLCKQLASNGPEINRLEAGMASSAFTLTSGNHECLLFPPSEGLKALGEFISLFSSPKALVHLNDSASLKGPAALLNQEEGEQTDAYLQDQRNKLLPALNLRLQLSRHHKGTVWQEAIVRPSAEARRPERLHSLHMGEQFPPKWLLTNGRPNYRQD